MEDQNSPPIPKKLSGVLVVVLATACWSTSGIFINLITAESGLSAVGLAFWRDLATSLTLLAGLALFRPRLLKIKWKDLPWLMAMGAISIGIFHILWNLAVVQIGASLATVVQCNAPIFVTLMAWFLFKEPLTLRKGIAVLLAVVGTVLVAGLSSDGNWKIEPLGLLIALGSAITYGSFSLFGKKLSGDYNAWTILFYVFSFGTVTLMLFQLKSPAPWPSSADILPWFSGLVLISTITGFALYTTGLQRLPASVASITATTEILFASILAYIVLNERMDVWQVFGAVAIICGVILVSLSKNNHQAKE
jgi:drug/metabolite transporter (DMT)-like permease